MSIHKFLYQQPFTLEAGITLPNFHLLYDSFGELNEAKDNVVWVFHALTANSNPTEWWAGLVGEGKLLSPKKYFIICVNMPGSCYGSINPNDVNAETGQQWFHNFPFFTTRDMARAYNLLRQHLGIENIYLGIGGSMGGQQLLEWAIEEPNLFENIVPIATNAKHSPWGIAFNASQRAAIEADKTWKEKNIDAGKTGLAVARSIALLSYRNYDAYTQTQQDIDSKLNQFKAQDYQQYQGEKLVKRFNAFSYYFLSKSMDAHNVARGRKSITLALQSIKAKTLVVGISSDILFPLTEQIEITEHIPNATFAEIASQYGHDGFLIEFEALQKLIQEFLSNQHLPLKANKQLKEVQP
jgi:homoserine O-acetyltransferase/O-succinyltransferase